MIVLGADQNLAVESIETQIVIVGGGGAGLCAAVAAAERGADVTLLEARNRPGGNTQYAFGFFAAESPVQKRNNVDAPKDVFFRLAMDYAGWQINPRVVRAWIDKSGDTVRWLEEKGIGIELDKLTRTQFWYTAPRCWHVPVSPVKLGAGVTEVLTKNFEDLGGRLLCQTSGKEILTDANGKICGISATRKGQELKIKASCVILATGGYGGNAELLKQYHQPYYSAENVLFTYPVYCMGDGLSMASKIGADSEGLGRIKLEPKGWPDAPREVWILAIQPDSIWLDKHGQRFCDESTYIDRGAGGFQVVLQLYRQYKDFTNYTFFDEGILKRIFDSQETAGHYRNLKKYAFDTSRKTVEEVIEGVIAKGHMKRSHSLDEIAAWMGVEPAALQTTVNEYNFTCDQGHDGIFSKDAQHLVALRTPPYYAIKCRPRFLNPMGGIKINHKMEACNTEGKAIPGVYAAGIDTGGWEGDHYNILLNGSFFSFALNSGRIAGENGADFVLKK